MPLYTKVSGTWRNAQKPYVKISNTWRQVATVYTKVNGVWRNLHTFTWATGAYGSCSASCGGGTMYRTVTCTRSDGLTFTGSTESVCTTLVGNKPSTSASCNTHGCETYSWYNGGWSGNCYCSNYTASRAVWCQRSDGVTVSDSYCSGSKPSTSTTCASIGMSSSCQWAIGSWSSCGIMGIIQGVPGCGNSLIFRNVYCYATRLGSGTQITDSNCTGSSDAGSKPIDEQTCYICNNCSLAEWFTESAVLEAKSKREGMTPAAIKQAMLNAGFGSVRNWWLEHGAQESVCPVRNSLYGGCCAALGYTWYA